ncbi:MAG: PrsW family glutamic-type intramembrane protease [Anaerolineales bacterium]
MSLNRCIGCVVFSLLLSQLGNQVALAEQPPERSDQELAETYAPVLYFHSAELFRPQSVDVLIRTAQLRQAQLLWFTANVLPQVSVSDLLTFQDVSYSLDAWYGDQGSSNFKNYSAHRAYYRTVLSPDSGGPPIVAYAHVVRDEDPEFITIQYWLFYYYNDAFNKHEGDWEMIEVVLSSEGEPQWVVLSQHHGGTRRTWGATRIEEGTHPATYVSLGSHANYFVGEELYPNGVTVGNAQFQVMDRTGSVGRVIPDVSLIPDREEVERDPTAWSGFEWLPFGGLWGEPAPQSDFGGPLGPAFKGEQWERPLEWGLAQPPDTDTWYANRLRVEINGQAAEVARVSLSTEGDATLTATTSHDGLVILHTDPPSDELTYAKIETATHTPYDMLVTWPDPQASQVTHYQFRSVPPGSATLKMGTSEPPSLAIEGMPGTIRASTSDTTRVLWDSPDVVWVAGILPATDVIKGVSIGLLAGILPMFLYGAGLYWFDRYEKEPMRLLAAAFLWGAIPAILVAAVVRVFFQLPPGLLGPEAIEALRVGLVSPIVEEALKGCAILFLARRYRHEFDNVLDGVIYGALVGFGFAMTGNIVSYLGAFLFRGFSGLSNTIFIQGLLYALDHAFYSAIFGAGLGYARLARRPSVRWTIPVAAFALAVATNAFHSFITRNAVSLNPIAVAATWAGGILLLVVMIWSMRRQRRCLETELRGEIPEELYGSLLEPWAGARELWRAFTRGGISSWRKMRRLRQLCGELAFKRMQARLFPDEPAIAEEVEAIRKSLAKLGVGA